MSIRTREDCVYIGAVIAELNTSEMALLFGLLIGEYSRLPDALFWDVIVKFSQRRGQPLVGT